MRQILRIREDSVWPEPAAPGAKRIVLLVHGYNNTQAMARESYDALREKVASCGASPTALENSWDVYWHGFVQKVVTLLPREEEATMSSVLTYSAQVPVARTAGRALGEFLLTLARDIEIIFISHSLGGRVVLEALRVLYQNQRTNQIRAYCLMAAAVPTRLLEPGGQLRKPAQIRNSHVLWSHWDMVLKLAFPPGQAMAGEPSSEAVGRGGNPLDVWTSNHATNLGHSGYYLRAAQNRYLFHSSFDTAPYLAPLFGAAIPKPVKEIALVEWYGAGQQPLPRMELPRREVQSRVRRWFGG